VQNVSVPFRAALTHDSVHYRRKCGVRTTSQCTDVSARFRTHPPSVLLIYCIQLNRSSVYQFACREKATGGHLVSVHDEQANSDVNCIVMKYNYSSPRIWLGGMELFQSKKFIWTDGSVWDFKKWVPGQPDNTNNTEDCVEMNWKSKKGERCRWENGGGKVARGKHGKWLQNIH
uniref:C-type lectin domain-containing protein n=1 Tax=Paramormyrops kingsleyae TaxID=1676925 RepID=A0A3B3Q1W8_9TELE